jgi:acyl carrier protein
MERHGPPSLTTIREWIVSRLRNQQGSAPVLDLDTDLIEGRLIDSLDFADFLFLLEEISGRPITLSEVDVDDFRTLRKIEARFLLPQITDVH